MWYQPYCFHENTMTISDISPTMFDITATVSVSSHLLYRWHYNKYGSHHTWHRTHSVWNLIDNLWYQCSVFDITTTIFDIVSTLSLSSHPLYWWYHTNWIYEISSTIYDGIISIVYNIIFTIFVTSQPLYLCLTPPLSMIWHPLYVWHYNHYMFYIIYTT